MEWKSRLSKVRNLLQHQQLGGQWSPWLHRDMETLKLWREGGTESSRDRLCGGGDRTICLRERAALGRC